MAYMHNHDLLHNARASATFRSGHRPGGISLSILLAFKSERSLTYLLVLSANNNWTKNQMNGASSVPFWQS
jgi:hypothetical protein